MANNKAEGTTTMYYRYFQAVLGLVFLCFSMLLFAQGRDFSKVGIKSHQLTDNVYMLEGAGGNIGLFVGGDGAFMIDDQFAPLTDKIVAAVRSITDKEIRFLINTHVHPDHVGGNENFGEMGALIFAHENVRERLREGITSLMTGKKLPAAPEEALPVVTYENGIKFHLNGEVVHVFPIPPAHTDGDSFIHFTGSDVLHLGDVFRTTTYPVVDVANGGSFRGIVNGLKRALELAGPGTKIIPGHGRISDKEGLRAVYAMYLDVRDKVQALIDEGKSLEEIIAARPTAEYDAEYDPGDAPVGRPDQFVSIIYNELKNE